MNGLSTAPRPPQPLASSSSSSSTSGVITSLTSRSKIKKCGATASKSLSEALATSVADLVCDHRKFNQESTSTSSTVQQQNMPLTTTSDNDENIAQSITDAQFTFGKEHVEPSPPNTRFAPRSSMSSAVADLASGMSIFQSTKTSSTNNVTTTTASEYDKPCQNNNVKHRNYHHGTTNNHCTSAPIISGTAAAVLALQKAPLHHDKLFDNIVSYNSDGGEIVTNADSSDTTVDGHPREGGGGGGRLIFLAPPNSRPTNYFSSHSPHSGEVDVVRSGSSPTIPIASATCSSSSSTWAFPTTSLPKFPTRYSDGAPVIAGTAAAAQMEANIATATAARILSISTSINNGYEDDATNSSIIHAVASLRPMDFGESYENHRAVSLPPRRDDTLGGKSGGANNSNESEHYHLTASTTTTNDNMLTVTTQGSAPISWMDHRENNYLRVTPEDGSSAVTTSYFHSSPAFHPPVALVSSSPRDSNNDALSSTITAGGRGMDILAEITCHAPPMILPTNSSQDSTNIFFKQLTSYSPENSKSLLFQPPSYSQESYIPSSSPESRTVQPSLFSHQSQHQYPTSPLNDEQPRVSSIPSYQEIYREMGIPHQYSGNQPQHHAQLSTSTYSVEEIEVDTYSTINHNHNDQQPLHNNIDPMDSTLPQMHSRTPTLHFGQVNRDHIEEGKELYTRKDLYQFGGHVSEAKDVHGNMKDGCDSIVIGCLEKDLRESDGLLWFLYSSDRANGGGALCQSYHKKRPIRVFRSSLLGGKYAPPYLDMEDDVEEDSDVAYRYDGLYMVCAVWDMQGQETESHPSCGENGWQTYFFTRLPKRPLEKEKWEGGMEYNAMGCQELWSTIQKMRGVRKPKKFEIPPPPVKLGQMKKCAIAGSLRERKRMGYNKPVIDNVEIAPAKRVPKSKRMRHDEEPIQMPKEDVPSLENQSNDADGLDNSDSDCCKKHEHYSMLSHDESPSKVLTPRPRLNSNPEPKKASPISHLHDAADSSDSESITFNPPPKNKNDRKQNNIPSNSHESSSSLDNLFFPKRASAARAEAANRNMFGGSRSYKRRSCETPVAAAYQPLRSGSGRKRNKIRHHDDSSSSEEEQSSDCIDSSILTIGSRVLVFYKGSLFKATIRKRREKDGTHDFLIHYDGNKKSNVHWISSDRINKILEINIDSPPQTNSAFALQKNKKIDDESKKPSLQNQDSMESISGDCMKDEGMSEKKAAGDPDERGKKEELPMNICAAENSSRTRNNRAGKGKEVFISMECNSNNESVDDTIDKSKSKKSAAVKNGISVDEIRPVEPPIVVQNHHRIIAVSDVCIARASRPSDPTSDESVCAEELKVEESDKKSVEKIENTALKQERKIDKMSNYKFSEGGHVYVEYRHILYSATILKRRKKRSASEYLVHYEGYKKSSNTWVKENTLHAVNAATTQRFKVQRLVPTSSNQSEQSSDVREVTNEKTASDSEPTSSDNGTHSSLTKKQPARRMRSDTSDVSLETLDSGVAFLAGSMVFVEWTGALYLAKMLKKRYSGDRMEYFISYDGYKSNHDAWVSVQKIYEVNPQTKRVFKKISSNLSTSSDGKQNRPAPPGTKQRETRRNSEECVDDATKVANTKIKPLLSAHSSRVSSTSVNTQMQGIETGVEFLPGSTLFAVYKNGLCLAKMLKKRGKGEYTEYLVQYNGLKRAEEAWVSTGSVYEINPRTKRMFRQLSVTKS